MARLVGSSTPGLVELSGAIEFLATWDVLVRSVCREVVDRPDKFDLGWRARAALGLLWRWKSTASFENGRPSIQIPEQCTELYAQIQAGERVCGACLGSLSADKFEDLESDFRWIEEAVSSYWTHYPSPVIPPQLDLV
jgi:hypothetical protein